MSTAVTSPFNAWDDPTGLVLGYGPDALSQKRMYLHQYPGVTIGASQTTLTRQNTAAAIQAAINACATNGWDLVVAPGVYEIDVAAGITVNGGQSNFAIRGSRASTFIQFHSNAPVLSVGDLTSTTAYSFGVVIDCLWLQYGATQTGNTGANILQVGALRGSFLSNLKIGADGGSYTAPNTPYFFPAYRCVFFTAGATEFSNVFVNFHVQGAQYRLVDLTSLGTGSIFFNWYCTNGYLGQPGQISDCAWFMTGGNDSVFSQINIESVAANTIVNAQVVRGTRFQAWHFESVQFTGANPTFWSSAFSKCTFADMNLTGFWFTSATLNTLTASGTLTLFHCFGDDNLVFESLYLMEQNAGDSVTLPIVCFGYGVSAGTIASVRALSIVADDFVSAGLIPLLSLDASLPLANFPGFFHVSDYRYDPLVSRIKNAVRVPVTGAYTAYGADEDAVFFLGPTGTYTFTASPKMTASGNGATTPTNVNARMCLNVATHSSGTITVADSSAGTLFTITASGNYFIRFDSTQWRQVT